MCKRRNSLVSMEVVLPQGPSGEYLDRLRSRWSVSMFERYKKRVRKRALHIGREYFDRLSSLLL